MYIDEAGCRRRESLSVCCARAFERVLPVRSFPALRDAVNWPGYWWSVTSRRHVCYESWVERDVAMMLDFDPAVITFSSQPFWLYWSGAAASRRRRPDPTGRADRQSARQAVKTRAAGGGRTKATTTPAWPRPDPPASAPPDRHDVETVEDTDASSLAEVVPLRVFDAREEASRFRAEFQRRLPPAYHDLAITDLQLFAIVRHAPVAQWHRLPQKSRTDRRSSPSTV
jgi:hypothetical protein